MMPRNPKKTDPPTPSKEKPDLGEEHSMEEMRAVPVPVYNGRLQIVTKILDFFKHIGIPATFAILLLLGMWQIGQLLLKSHTEFLNTMSENARRQSAALERIITLQELHAKELRQLSDVQGRQLELQNKILLEMSRRP